MSLGLSKLFNKVVITFIISFVSFAALASSNTPLFIGKIKLVFENEISCELTDFNDSKSTVKGRSNIVHDESTISWTSSCIIQLPQNIKYCALVEQEVSNPDTFVSLYSGFQSKVLRAKIISESDVNPSFGVYSTTYYCFD